jgi:hypothetical protein
MEQSRGSPGAVHASFRHVRAVRSRVDWLYEDKLAGWLVTVQGMRKDRLTLC